MNHDLDRHAGGVLWLASTVRHVTGMLAMLTFGLLPMAAAHAEAPACQIIIGSCHRTPLSNAAGTGSIDRVVIEAFRRIGYAACIEPQTCERSLRNADSGVADGELLRVPAAVAASSPNLVVVPEVLYALPMSGFTAQPDLSVNGLNDLLSLRVGYVVGWKILEERVRAREILRVRGPVELFQLFQDKKVDLVIYERITGLHLVKEMGIQGIHPLDPPLLVTPQHLMLNRRHQHLAEPLANAIRALKADGTYAASFKSAGDSVPETK